MGDFCGIAPHEMLFISSDGTIINTSSNNPYYKKALELREKWFSEAENFTIHTSGSTGKPKEIILTRSQIKASISQTQKAFNLVEGDTAFCCLNIEYIAGMLMLFRAFEIGMDVLVVEPSSNPFESLGNQQYLLQSSKGNNFFAFVPLQIENILEKNPESLLTAKAIIVGGASVNETTLEKIQQISKPIYATYGMTETVTHIAIKQLNGVEKTDYFEILEGIEIKTDSRNCIQIKGQTTNNEWITTNDVVELINEKQFKLIGRADNIINSGGVKIQLEKVENVVEKILHEKLINQRFFCFGILDEKLGQKLVLIIEGETQSESNNTEIITALSQKLPKFEVPKEIFWIERFIETPTNKIDKNRIINEFILNKISDR